jgi:DNA invertase Pin-like site-specific DNA recombinase
VTKERSAQKRVAVYLRVSTGEQTTDNQRRELEEVATRHGWRVVEFFEDAGISGAKGRDKRPGLDRLLKAVARRDVDMVAAWSVDRLGRSLIDLLDFLRELHAKGVDLFLHQQGLDTSTPSGRAMFQMLGVFAEFERAMIRERVMAGLSRAKADGIQLGRRRLEDSDANKVAAIVAARAKGTGIRRIARELGVGVGTVLRVTGEARLGASALLAHGMAQAARDQAHAHRSLRQGQVLWALAEPAGVSLLVGPTP